MAKMENGPINFNELMNVPNKKRKIKNNLKSIDMSNLVEIIKFLENKKPEEKNNKNLKKNQVLTSKGDIVNL